MYNDSDPFATCNYMQPMCFNVCALCDVCWTEAVGMQCVVVLCTSRRAQAWWLVTCMGPDHHMHMCQRSQPQTYKHTETHNYCSTHTMCLCVGFVGTRACDDSRSRCVTTGHVMRHSPIFTHPFSVTVPTDVCLITWCCSIFTEVSLITTLTEQLCSHC